KKAPRMRRQERKKLARTATGRKSFEQAAQRLVDRGKRTVGILSLSERTNNFWRWAHYAGSHSGICVELRPDVPPADQALKVVYSRDYPQINFFELAQRIEGSGPEAQSAQREWVNALLLTKSIDWSYEEEWRILDTTGGRG